MDIIWTTLAVIVIFWLGFHFGRAHTIVTLAREMANELGSAEPGDETEFSIEKHQNQYFAYAADQEFLGQGTDLRSLMLSMRDRWPGRRFRISQAQDQFTADENHQLVRAIFEVFGNQSNKEEGKL